MREIKFRQPLRDKQGKFIEWFYWGFIDVDWIQWATQQNGLDTRNESQQFTGLTDKNNVPIYEGDIVKYFSLDNFTQQSHADINPEIDTYVIKTYKDVVVFNDAAFRVSGLPFDYIGLESIEDIKETCGCTDDENCDINGNEINDSILGIEVIGNVYQNPELTTPLKDNRH